ncbi:hypothetical protein [Rosenbergiella metrosideri]|uniref:hypothetical protein n=1 Tax=Rosenbergiella metrosideri TaxID=2921185 RepID=UPI001F500142|nr:hypothetical protein [Rosenbergiella metrosideri]
MDSLQNKDISKPLIKAVDTDDIVGAVLRIHLIAELLIDSWISARTSCPNIFGSNKKDRILIECSKKISIAERLGLPGNVCKVISKINTIRNDFAHKINPDDIKEDDMVGLIQSATNMVNETSEAPIEDHTLRINDENEVLKYEITIKSPPELNKYKLLMILLLAMKIITNHVAKNHKGKWDSNYSQFDYSVKLSN